MQVVTSVWFERRGLKRQVSLSYKLLSDNISRSPRHLSKWLDDKDDAFIRKELEGWKDRVNLAADQTSLHFPEFFLRQRTDFLKWCAKSAKSSTIEGYLHCLGRFVFPYFVLKLKQDKPERWQVLLFFGAG